MLKLVAGAFVVISFMGCAHGKMGVIDQPLSEGAVSKTTPIVVETVQTNDIIFSGDKAKDTARTNEEKATIESRYARMIAESLRKRGYNAHVAEGGKADAGLVLSGKVTRFEHGSGAARYFVGMGAGSSNMYTDFKLEDRSKKQVLTKFEVIATSGGNSRPSSFMEAHLEDGSNKVAEYIDKPKK